MCKTYFRYACAKTDGCHGSATSLKAPFLFCVQLPTMMFRNVHEEEESASDWDDLTPHASPQLHQKSLHHTPSPPHLLSSPSRSFPSQPHLLITRSSHEKTESDGVEFISLEDQESTTHPPPKSTPPVTHPVYTVVTSQSPSTPPPNPILTSQDQSSVPSPVSPPTVRVDESGTAIQPSDGDCHQSQRGVFLFNAVAHTRQVDVETEKMQNVVMARYADRSEQFFRRLFREVFSTIRLCTDVFIMFLLECAHCFAFHFLRKLCCGLLFIILSALSAPGLTNCYNVVFWPLAVCSSQICQAMRIVATPCIECFGGIVGRCVEVVSAFRPVHVVSYKSHEPYHTQPSHHHRVSSPHDSV